jgi:hypothetical protein
MGKNAELGLPRDKMKTIVIAVDVDGTLRCNCTPTCEDPNARIVSFTNALLTMKNTEVVVWSGGGKEYAQRFVDKFFTPKAAKKITTMSKFAAGTGLGKFTPDIAIDDIQDTALGKINLIVREK